MSVHNVEVYRCRACGEDVAVSPAGFSLLPEDVALIEDEHRRACAALTLERIAPDAEG